MEEVFLRVANGTADAVSRKEITRIASDRRVALQEGRNGTQGPSAVVVDAAIDNVSFGCYNG